MSVHSGNGVMKPQVSCSDSFSWEFDVMSFVPAGGGSEGKGSSALGNASPVAKVTLHIRRSLTCTVRHTESDFLCNDPLGPYSNNPTHGGFRGQGVIAL